MDFSLDEHQQAVVDVSSGLLANEVELARPVGERGYDEQAWDALAKAGLLALGVPAELGGEGLGVGEVAVLLTEIGRVAAPVPALATLAMGVLPITQLGSQEQRNRLLPEIGAGHEVVTAALNEPSSPFPHSPCTEAYRVAGGWALSGIKTGVAYADVAMRILVPASTPHGVHVFLVDPAATGITLRKTPTATHNPEFTLRLEGVVVADVDVLSDDDGNSAQVLHRYAIAGATALAAGVLAGVLELTTEHVRQREQFGRPLAAFQAVAQQVADVYITSRTLRLAATTATWRLAAGLDPDSDLDVASYWLTTQAPPAVQTCHHLHGGIGLDVTYPLHHYSSLITDLVRFVGGGPRSLERLGELVKGSDVCTWN